MKGIKYIVVAGTVAGIFLTPGCSQLAMIGGGRKADRITLETHMAAERPQTAPQERTAPRVERSDHPGGGYSAGRELDFSAWKYDDHTLNIAEPEVYDSLLSRWYEQNVVSSYDEFFKQFIDIDMDETLTSDVPDSVYRARMRLIVSPVSLGYNDIIKRYIVSYTTRNAALIGRVLGLSQFYFPMIEEELARHGLPLELRMLPVIESALNPTAVSRVGATGLWQFMLATGKSYGLEVTSMVDDRRDPVKATEAACRYMADLYRMYDDWTLAIAAYNCGPGNVNKALKRAGDDAKTFWDIYPYLPSETRGYVPSFVAVNYAYAFHKQHDIRFVKPPLPISTDTVSVNRLMHLEQVSSTLDIPIEAVRALNPQYKEDIIPAVDRTYALRLPQYDISRYLSHEQEIMAKDTLYLAKYINQPAENLKKELTASTTRYTVKSGDTLGGIARRHGVTVAQIVKWNNFKNANVTIRPGQRIEIQTVR